MTQLDLTGPFEVLHRVPGAEMHLVWKDRAPVRVSAARRDLLAVVAHRHELAELDRVEQARRW